MINYQRILELINKYNSFLITTHVNPDGDALGSELALAYFLRELGKKFYIINHSPTPENYVFLDEENLIRKYSSDLDDVIENVDMIFALDFNHLGRVRSMMEAFERSKAYKIIIDHHRNPQNFVNEYFIDIDAPATGILIYKLIASYNVELIDKKIANALYTAIMTDTGSFRFERITPEVHLITADLIQRGADPTYIYNKIYNELTYDKLLLLGNSITNIKLIYDGKIAYTVLNRELIRKYVPNELEFDVEGFVNFCLSVKDTLVGILFYELPNTIKVSLRSKEKFPVNQLAEKFGGGGHLNAAGIRFDDAALEEVIQKVLAQTIEDLKTYSGEDNA